MRAFDICVFIFTMYFSWCHFTRMIRVKVFFFSLIPLFLKAKQSVHELSSSLMFILQCAFQCFNGHFFSHFRFHETTQKCRRETDMKSQSTNSHYNNNNWQTRKTSTRILFPVTIRVCVRCLTFGSQVIKQCTRRVRWWCYFPENYSPTRTISLSK